MYKHYLRKKLNTSYCITITRKVYYENHEKQYIFHELSIKKIFTLVYIQFISKPFYEYN